MKLLRFCDWLMVFSFSCLFFLVPLILTPFNYELFEYNKMMLVYGLTIIITGTWLIKMVVHKKFLFQRTPLDLPLLLFLLSQVISTFVSIDPHVSLFGYYSRFNGGLFSTISYLILYYAFVSNFSNSPISPNSTKSRCTSGRSTISPIIKFLKLSLLSGLIVSLYGIAEHFGIDKNLWVQDVQNRVFSTLGQPNWLGAYLAIMIPIGISFLTNSKFEYRNSKQSPNSNDKNSKRLEHSYFENLNLFRASDFGFRIFAFYFLLSAFYLCLLYTKSRSGLIGFGIAFGVFMILAFLSHRPHPSLSLQERVPQRVRSKEKDLASQGDVLRNFFRPFILLFTFFFLLSVLVGTPFTPSLSSIIYHPSSVPAPTGPALETGGTESGEIRKIVWQGAIEIARHYPLFGTGPETFAFAYYQFRPVAHNLVSEWDFLYNKAHNEYLNYAATTGFVGLGTYLLFIGWFIVWSLKKVFCHSRESGNPDVIARNVETKSRHGGTTPFGLAMTIGLLAGFISILITNFFGFSVVVTSVYFWLIPAMVVVINAPMPQGNKVTKLEQQFKQSFSSNNNLTMKQYLIFIVILLATFYLLLTIIRFWYADVRFNRGYQLSRAGYYQQAYQPFHEAIEINPQEPFYRDELSYADAVLSVAALQQKDSTLSAQLAKEAVFENQKALLISPSNVNFYKTQTKVYYTLSSLNPNADVFNQKALESLQKAKTLAPTDPKITYNIALLLGRLGKNQQAVKTLEEAISLKANYQDARFALALFHHEAGQKKEAIAQLEYILKYLSPTDKQIQEKLKEWRN